MPRQASISAASGRSGMDSSATWLVHTAALKVILDPPAIAHTRGSLTGRSAPVHGERVSATSWRGVQSCRACPPTVSAMV
jgi:hypothetical protein